MINRIDEQNNICNLMKDVAEIYCAKNVQDGLHRLTIFGYQLVIIDKLRTMEYTCNVIKCIRKINANIFILYLSSDDTEKKVGIESGADVTLPQKNVGIELKTQSFALLRRFKEWDRDVKSFNIQESLLYKDYMYRKVYWDQSEVKLTSYEFDFLFLLAATPGRVYPYEQIYQIVWKDFTYGDVGNVVWCMVYRLKKKLRAFDSRAAAIIHNIRNVGYYFESEMKNGEKQI